MTKIYYGPQDDHSDDYRLVPAPTIAIDKEFIYANDTVIGYTYTLTLNGYITNYRKLTDDPNDSETNPDYYAKNIEKVLKGIEFTRKILSRNGSCLEVKDIDKVTVLKAKGGTLRSLNFSETNNNWSTYSTFTAQIEFNEIELLGETLSCNSGDIDDASKTSNLVDIEKYKIKSFTESWSFNISETSFDYVRNIDTGQNLSVHNMIINASYNISATGKNYYNNINDGTLVPSHEQARIFCQDRIYNKVKDLVNAGTSKILKISQTEGIDPCPTDLQNLNTIHGSGPGLLGNITYLPYNENITCEISESDGTFSASYSCILKSKSTGDIYCSPDTIHTVSCTRNKRIESNNKSIYTINVEGNVRGLFLGGLIYSDGNFKLPSSGSVIMKANDGANRYTSANNFYPQIGEENDLNDNFKNILGITYTNLHIVPCSGMPPTPKPSSFNLTRNYIEGIITYNAEYNSNDCIKTDGGSSIQNISFTVDNPTPVIAEFIIPNGGVIIQDIKTFTAKKINVTISGRENRDRVCCANVSGVLSNLINCDPIPLPSGVALPDPSLYILTQKNRTDDKLQGTYTINLSYICDPGCEI